MCVKLLEKQEQAKFKTSRREIIKISAKNQQNSDQKIKKQRVNDMKSWFFEKINKIDKTLASLTRMRRKKTQIRKKHQENPGNH
jgi:hypothetical protein